MLIQAEQVFADMDKAYNDAAAFHGFQCRGCEDNCCRSLFFHHTLVEYLWLRAGLSMMPTDGLSRIRQKATAVVASAAGSDGHQRLLCPLNEESRCILYAHRPMICRLHGIPHRLRGPAGQIKTSPGCDAFYSQAQNSVCDQIVFDRTPLYTALAQLERQLRQSFNYYTKIKMTIAEMVLKEPPEFEVFDRFRN